jgi:hypothetical protein
MSTAEDVFSLYERNFSIYYDCNKNNKIDTCPNMWKGFCYCFCSQPLLPNTIGNTGVLCNVKRKCYIKPGEECPICMDPITTKSTAYLTTCGHSFHKLCIFKCMEKKWTDKYGSCFHCPMCRTNLGMDIHDINERYNYGSIKCNNLDLLENFWLKKDFTIAYICRNKFDHYLGMKRGCQKCENYVSEGKHT